MISSSSFISCGSKVSCGPVLHLTTKGSGSQLKVVASTAADGCLPLRPGCLTSSSSFLACKLNAKLTSQGSSLRTRTSLCASVKSADGAQLDRAKPSPGGSAGEDSMSADLRHMREAGPIGDSAAGVAGKARSAEELEAADETAEELGSPAKTALASDYGPGASAVNPGVDSAGEIDYSKAAVQPGSLPSASSIGSAVSRDSPLQESDSAPGAQGFSGQENGSEGEVLAENFEAQAARQPEAFSGQVQGTPGSGGNGPVLDESTVPKTEKTSENKVSLVPDEDLVGSKSTKDPKKKAPGGRKDLNDSVGPTHQAL